MPSRSAPRRALPALLLSLGGGCHPDKPPSDPPPDDRSEAGERLGCFDSAEDEELFDCALPEPCDTVQMDGHVRSYRGESPDEEPAYELQDLGAYTCFFDALALDEPAHLTAKGVTSSNPTSDTYRVWLVGGGRAVLSGSSVDDDAYRPWSPTLVAVDLDAVSACRSETAGAEQWRCLEGWWGEECLDEPVECPA